MTTDGGTTAPPSGIVRNAALLRVELQPGLVIPPGGSEALRGPEEEA